MGDYNYDDYTLDDLFNEIYYGERHLKEMRQYYTQIKLSLEYRIKSEGYETNN